jgi:hypothetical protein
MITKIETDDLHFVSRAEKHKSISPDSSTGSENFELSSTNSLFRENHDEFGFNVHTMVEGVQGRVFSFLAENFQACAEWIEAINNAALLAKKNSVPFYINYQVVSFFVSRSSHRH